MANRYKDWLDQALRDLDQARYPNGHAEGPPFQHYGHLQSTQALEHAGTIIDFVRSEVA